MKHEVIKDLLGRHYVSYSCPNCNAELKSPLVEAGDRYPCPTCAAIHEVPGTADRKKFEATEEARKQVADRERVADTERRRQNEIRAQAERKLRDDQASQMQSRGAKGVSATDRFLHGVFSIAKGLSALVVAACIVAIALAIVGWISVLRPSAVAVTIPQIQYPTLKQFRDATSSRPTQRSSAPTQDDVASQAGISEGAVSLVERHLRQYPFSHELVLEYLETVGSNEKESIVTGLAGFLSAADSAQPVVPMNLSLVSWYLRVLDRSRDEVSEAIEQNAAMKRQAEIASNARQTFYLSLGGIAFLTLLGFLILPLLIEIEQNTRRTLGQLVVRE